MSTQADMGWLRDETERLVTELLALREQVARHAEQARAISHLLEGTGCGPCPLPEGVFWVVTEKTRLTALVAWFEKRTEWYQNEGKQTEAENTRLREALTKTRDVVDLVQWSGYVWRPQPDPEVGPYLVAACPVCAVGEDAGHHEEWCMVRAALAPKDAK